MHDASVPIFRDAQQIHRLNPAGFEVPSADRLERIVRGSVVKVSVAVPDASDETSGERFWVEVLERHGDRVVGRVDNQLLRTEDHRLALHDRIEFSLDNIYDVYD